MEITHTIPIFRIFDVLKALEFYEGFLGFHVDWQERVGATDPVYMQVSRAGMTLHLSEHYGDGCPGATIFARITGLAAFHAELTAKDYPYLRPGVEPTPWNTRVMEVVDPFGNRIRFSEDVTDAKTRYDELTAQVHAAWSPDERTTQDLIDEIRR